MTVKTRSVFYYGHLIDDTNFQLDFDEGSGELVAEINVGSYSLSEFRTELERALNAASTLPQLYSVTLDRDTRQFTVTAPGSFSMLVSSGTHSGTSVYTLAGFTGADRASDTSHTGDTGSGSEYLPQLELQDYTPTSNFRKPTSAAVNIASSGEIEVVRFGDIQFMECNIAWITNQDVSSTDWLDNNPTAVEDTLDFLDKTTKKSKVEFMEDRDSRSIFETMLLDKTKDSKDGVGYRLYEFLKRKLPDWYETKTLTFRKL
jgi:hypothetical protein